MRKAVMAGMMFSFLVSAAPGHDAVLTGALARTVVPPGQLHGTIEARSVVKGGSSDERNDETIDVQHSPKRALPSYSDLAKVIGSDAHVVSHDGTRTVYEFTTQTIPDRNSNPGHVALDDAKENSGEVFNGKAEVDLDAAGLPFISHVELRLAKTMGKLIVRVKQIDLSYSFLPLPIVNAMITTGFTADVDVRALLFVHRNAHYEESFAAAKPSQ